MSSVRVPSTSICRRWRHRQVLQRYSIERARDRILDPLLAHVDPGHLLFRAIARVAAGTHGVPHRGHRRLLERLRRNQAGRLVSGAGDEAGTFQPL